jgi:hypothetical protein
MHPPEVDVVKVNDDVRELLTIFLVVWFVAEMLELT